MPGSQKNGCAMWPLAVPDCVPQLEGCMSNAAEPICIQLFSLRSLCRCGRLILSSSRIHFFNFSFPE